MKIDGIDRKMKIKVGDRVTRLGDRVTRLGDRVTRLGDHPLR